MTRAQWSQDIKTFHGSSTVYSSSASLKQQDLRDLQDPQDLPNLLDMVSMTRVQWIQVIKTLYKFSTVYYSSGDPLDVVRMTRTQWSQDIRIKTSGGFSMDQTYLRTSVV